MTDSRAGRRFLISVGVGTYKDSGIPDLPGAVADADQVAALLAPMGYTRALADLSRNPSRNALVEGLDEWALETGLGPQDVIVVYFAGHGQKNGPKHYLLCANHRPGLWSSTAVKSDDFAEPLVQSDVGHLLVVLDTCFASAGTESVATLAAQLTDRRRGSAQRAVLAAARGKEQAKENKFVDALARVLAKPQAGPSQRYLSVREVTARINELLDSPTQHASHSVIDSAGQDPFFDNRLYIPAADRDGLDLAVLAQLHKRHEGHYGPRGRGLEHAGERGSYFTGRVPALSSLAGWLGAPHDRKARVVTGDPGSGKSALLGRFLELTEAEHPARTTHPGAGWLPPLGMDVVRLWARRVTGADLVRDLGAALALPDAGRDELLEALGERSDPVTIVIDALDEAGTAGDQSEGRRIARELLQPLSAMPAVRLLIGTRRNLISALGHAIEVIDLDADEHAREAVTEYAHAILLDAHDPDSLSPYRGDPEAARAVASGIAAQAGRSFLVARMNARALVHRQEMVDTTVDGWERSLPGDAREAFAAYLDRFGEGRQRVVRLLRPLAYAQGEGLPWSTVWAPLAEALSGTACTNDDLDWLFENAGSYITESDHGTGSVYRLYHETMAEYLRVPSRAAEHHRAVATGLAGLVPADPINGERDWATAHPYILTHLASHAAAGGDLDRLVTDTEYLVHAHPASLLRALDSADSERGRRLASVYRTSAHLLPRLPVDNRRDVLSVDAARYRWRELSQRFALGREWKVRWATGALVHPAHRRTVAVGRPSVFALDGVSIGNRPHVLTRGGTRVELWDLRTGECTLTLEEPGAPRAACGLTLDNHPHALVGDQKGTIGLWDLHTGEPVRTLTGHSAAVQTVASMDFDGRPHALTGGEDHTVRLWDLSTGECRLVIETANTTASVRGVTIDGRPHVFVRDHLGHAAVWDLHTGVRTRSLGQLDGPTCCSTLDGRAHVLAASGTHMHLWDLTTGRQVRSFTGHTLAVRAVRGIVIDGQPHALTGGDDESVRLWDLRTGECKLVLIGHTNFVHSLCDSDLDGHPHAISTGFDGTLRLWDLTSTHAVPSCEWHTDWITDITEVVLDDRPHVLTGSYDGSARLWDIDAGECVDALPLLERGDAVDCVVIDDRPHALTLDADGIMHLWDVRTGERVRSFSGGTGELLAGDLLTMDCRPHLVTASYERSVELWDLSTGQCSRNLDIGDRAIEAIVGVVVDDRPYALTTAYDPEVRMWDFESGRCVRVLTGHTSSVEAMCRTMLDNRPHLLTGSYDHTVHLWDLHTGETVLRLTGHTAPVKVVRSVTVDGKPHALTAAEDHTARLWNLRTGECTHTVGIPLAITAATVVDNQLILCFANDMALFER
ncbi:WD40 repeat protein [Streptomyces luteogriseus]|uniref:WD40 repeat protein n=1 Tax=Streptomyces luteogriseus TaxID=68233 RepID=A0A7W7DJN3_9ACTN|nr:caspase family protein [Streptomyces luteogriseus]MBB4711673.1 WD40 repeat protein [Streptomyces luteogriseus]